MTNNNYHNQKNLYLKLLLESSALKFGTFITKAGRETPYFFNSGCLATGTILAEVGQYYAETIAKNFPDTTNIYGPAYKGIPLAVITAEKLGQILNRPIGYTFNRKEEKKHGDKGILVGQTYSGDEKIVIVEDVITGGTSLRETHQLLLSLNAHVIGIVAGIDRQEIGTNPNKLASQEISELYGVPVVTLLNMENILEQLDNKTFLGKIWVDQGLSQKITKYRSQYGLKV